MSKEAVHRQAGADDAALAVNTLRRCLRCVGDGAAPGRALRDYLRALRCCWCWGGLDWRAGGWRTVSTLRNAEGGEDGEEES